MLRGLVRVSLRRNGQDSSKEAAIAFKTKSQIQLDMHLRPRKTPRYPPQVKEKLNRLTAPPQPLKYKLRPLPENHDPLVPLGGVEGLPFFVERTASGNLPVYRDYGRDRAKKLTIVRKVTGDVEELMAELTKVTSNSEVTANVGSVQVAGLHKQVVEEYLMRLGF